MEIGSSARLPISPTVADGRAASPAPGVPATPERSPDSARPHVSAPARSSDAQPSPDAVQPTHGFSDALRRQITLDQETHKVVYEAVDTRTGNVVYQMPDLRYLKAYADQLKVAEEEPTPVGVERLA